MAEEKNQITQSTEDTAEKISVKFDRPYVFEGKEYTELDLSGLNSLTVKDAADIQLRLFNEQEVAAALLCETTAAFARAVAAKATGLPVEFFKLMPLGASRRVNATVRGYVNAQSATEGQYLAFETPYTWKGKVYEGVDISGVANLTGMNESEAENRLARAGYVITETSFNYLYACILLSMATGLEEGFFTGLPLRETLKLKNAVNNSGFFD